MLVPGGFLAGIGLEKMQGYDAIDKFCTDQGERSMLRDDVCRDAVRAALLAGEFDEPGSLGLAEEMGYLAWKLSGNPRAVAWHLANDPDFCEDDSDSDT